MSNVPLEGLAAEYASAVECRRALTGALRRRLLEVAAQMGPALREATAAEQDCRAALISAVEAAPELFEKPKTRQVHGIKYGYQQGKDVIEIPDEAETIKRIRERLPPGQQALLINVKESVYKPAVLDLTAADLRLLKVRQITGACVAIAKPVADAADRLVAALLEEAAA